MLGARLAFLTACSVRAGVCSGAFYCSPKPCTSSGSEPSIPAEGLCSPLGLPGTPWGTHWQSSEGWRPGGRLAKMGTTDGEAPWAGVFTGSIPAPCPFALQVPHPWLRRLWPHHRELRFAPQVSLPRQGCRASLRWG